MKKQKKKIYKPSFGAEIILSFRNRTFTDRKKKEKKEACRKWKP